MKIRNKRELVLRAKGHAREDHIIQGTYGDGSTNGHTTFEGCFIGCLATPHRKRELRAWIKSVIASGWHNHRNYGMLDTQYDMLERLKEEFGIETTLARACEQVFENLPTHGAAINFLPEFAEALPEGVNITWRMVDQWETRFQGATGSCSISDDAEAARDSLLAWLRSLDKANA